MKLPLKYTDNPIIIAEKFLVRENLDPLYK